MPSGIPLAALPPIFARDSDGFLPCLNGVVAARRRLLIAFGGHHPSIESSDLLSMPGGCIRISVRSASASRSPIMPTLRIVADLAASSAAHQEIRIGDIGTFVSEPQGPIVRLGQVSQAILLSCCSDRLAVGAGEALTRMRFRTRAGHVSVRR